jgi:peptidyl-prolyl cis-trans isomerase B (cyclophilin B)
MVKLHTNLGTITLELDAERAPATVENFLAYVKSGFYSNTIFHRVIDGFMVQSGGFEPGMKQKPTRGSIKNEAQNGLKNQAYTVAMARTPDPHSASSQFFINVTDNAFLDFRAPNSSQFGYCVFARVVDGKAVVDQIKKVATTTRGAHSDVPVEDVVITNAEEV